MKCILTFATVLSSVVLLSGNASAQQEVAHHTSAEHRISAPQQIIPGAFYSEPFKAVVFPRLNGNVSVNVQKGRHETVTVHIYNSEGQLVKQDTLSNRRLITKEYTFKGLTKGVYTFEVAGSDKLYVSKVVIN